MNNREGKYERMRALLDSGSECCLLTTDACKKLGSQNMTIKTNIEIKGIKGIGILNQMVRKEINNNIKSQFNDFNADLSCYIGN